MKTKILILIFALVALTASVYGQRSSIRERLFNKHSNQVEFITAEYSNENSRIENWMHDLHNWVSKRAKRSVYMAPAVAESIFLEDVDLVYDEQPGIESWMTTPFECGVPEEKLEIESWMTVPFENSLFEEDLEIESWMTVPFENSLFEEDLEIESWMTLPFESSLAEDPVYLESWMAIPFEVAEEIELEEWMVKAWI